MRDHLALGKAFFLSLLVAAALATVLVKSAGAQSTGGGDLTRAAQVIEAVTSNNGATAPLYRCTTTATQIPCPNGTRTVTVQVDGSTAVNFGGSWVTATSGQSVCATGCSAPVFGVAGNVAWCLSTSGTVDVRPLCVK